MKVCDMCGDVAIVYEDGDVCFCKKHAIEMKVEKKDIKEYVGK